VHSELIEVDEDAGHDERVDAMLSEFYREVRSQALREGRATSGR